MLNFVIKKITFILKLPSALEPPHLSDDLTAKRMMLMALREGYSILSYVKSLLVFQPVWVSSCIGNQLFLGK
ncbi:hypothetical protein ACQGYV_003681, partial [Escherichia coli]